MTTSTVEVSGSAASGRDEPASGKHAVASAEASAGPSVVFQEIDCAQDNLRDLLVTINDARGESEGAAVDDDHWALIEQDIRRARLHLKLAKGALCCPEQGASVPFAETAEGRIGDIESAMRTTLARLNEATLAMDSVTADDDPEQEDLDTLVEGVRAARAHVRCMLTDWIPALQRALKERES